MFEDKEQKHRIVVGFDGSEGSKRALTWAVEEARSHGGSLEVVRAWMPGEIGTDSEQAVTNQKRLDDGIVEVIGEHPGLQIDSVAERGHAAKVLLGHAGAADMLVVGSRGHGGFTGLLLGSVGQHVATHTGAPVVVIVR